MNGLHRHLFLIAAVLVAATSVSLAGCGNMPMVAPRYTVPVCTRDEQRVCPGSGGSRIPATSESPRQCHCAPLGEITG